MESVEKKVKLPSYVYKENLAKRYDIIKPIGLSEEDKNVLNTLCEYALVRENAWINLDQFLSEYEKLNLGLQLKRKITLNRLTELIQLFERMEVELMVYAKEEDGSFSFADVILKEPPSEREQDTKRINAYLEEVFEKVSKHQSYFPSLKELQKKFANLEKTLKTLLEEVKIAELSPDKFKTLGAQSEKPLLINLEETKLDFLVIPASQVKHFSEYLINLIASYYFQESNEQLRSLVRAKLKEKNLSEGELEEFLQLSKLHTSYFLFFVQLYYNIFFAFQDKISRQGAFNVGVRNQLIAAYLLVKLCRAQRNFVKQRKAQQEKKAAQLQQVVKLSLTHSNFVREGVLYTPIALGKILKLPIPNEEKEAEGETEEQTFGALYSRDKILTFLEQYNTEEDFIKEVLAFESEKEWFFIHRFRLLSSFLSLLEEERQSLFALLVYRWSAAPQQMLAMQTQEELNEFVKQEQLINPLFQSYFDFIINLLTQVFQAQANYSTNYLTTRLFANEREILNWKAFGINLEVGDQSKKNNLVKIFLDTLFKNNFKAAKTCLDALDISFLAIKKHVVQTGAIRLPSLVFYRFKNFFQLKKIFSGLSAFLVNFSLSTGSPKGKQRNKEVSFWEALFSKKKINSSWTPLQTPGTATQKQATSVSSAAASSPASGGAPRGEEKSAEEEFYPPPSSTNRGRPLAAEKTSASSPPAVKVEGAPVPTAGQSLPQAVEITGREMAEGSIETGVQVGFSPRGGEGLSVKASPHSSSTAPSFSHSLPTKSGMEEKVLGVREKARAILQQKAKKQSGAAGARAIAAAKPSAAAASPPGKAKAVAAKFFGTEKKLSQSNPNKPAAKNLVRQLPLLADEEKLEKQLEQDLEGWNLKIGKNRSLLKQAVDQRIAQLVKRFDFQVFSGDIKNRLYTLLTENDKVFAEIANKDALMRYIYHRAYQIKYQSALEK